VVAIIALLAAILFPVFSRARENARRAACQSNLKQLGLGLAQYLQDYDANYPPGQYMSYGAGWDGQVYEYLKSVQISTCPDDTTVINTPGFTPASYGFNINMTGISDAKLKVPAATVMLCEMSHTVAQVGLVDEGMVAEGGTYQYALSAAVDGRDGSANCQLGNCIDMHAAAGNGYFYQVAGSFQGYIQYATGYLGTIHDTLSNGYLGPTGRHLDTSNFLFADGHVKALLAQQVSPGLTAKPGRYQGQDQNGYSAAATNDMFLGDGITPVQGTFSPI